MIFLHLYLITLYLAPQLWIPPFVGLPVDYIIYPLWFFYALLSGSWSKMKFGPPDYFFMAFIVWVCLSIIVAGTTYTLVPIVLLRYTKWLVLYLLIRCTVTTPERLRSAALSTVVLVYVLVLEGIQHKLSPNGTNWAGQSLGWVDPAVLEAGGSGRTKWVGVFDGIGVFCVVYTNALPFVLQYASSGFRPLVTWLNRVGLVLLLVAIYFTGSRGGFLATLAVISLHLAVKYRVSVKMIAIASTVITLAFTAAPASLTQTKDSSNSAQNRVDVWAQGLQMLTNHPIVGVGRGNFVQHTRTIIAHNSGVEILAETGIIGMFLWVSLIVATLRCGYLRFVDCESPLGKHVLAATILAVIGYIVSSLFVTLEYETFYMLLALCVGGFDFRNRDRAAYRGREFWTSCAVVMIFAMVIKVVVVIY